MTNPLRKLWEERADSSAPRYAPNVKRYLTEQYGRQHAEGNTDTAKALAVSLARILAAAEMANELRAFTDETICELQGQLNDTTISFLESALRRGE